MDPGIRRGLTMPCERCVSRRDFLAAAGAGALIAAVGACGDGEISGVRVGPPGGVTERVTIVAGEFPGLATVGFLVQVSPLFAAKRTGPSTFDAFDMRCTHAGCLTNVTNGQRFDCICHGSRFDNNGAVLREPARDPLTKLATAYNAATDELTIN